MRQQRTQNNRGSLQTPNLRPVADMAWRITGLSGADVELTIEQPSDRLFLQSTPPFVGASPPQQASAAVLVGNVLTVTFPAQPDAGSTISLESTTPGVRSKLGAYMAAGVAEITVPPSPPTPIRQVPWILGTVVGPFAQLDLTVSTETGLNCALDTIVVQAGATAVQQVLITPGRVEITCSAPLVSGDTIELLDSLLTSGTATACALTPQTVVVP